MRAYVTRVLEWIGARELGALVAVLIAAAGIWLFAELADDVLEGDTQDLDEQVLLALRTAADASDPLGPPWAEEMARDVTGLGSAGILGLITLAAAGFLFLQGKRHLAVYVIGAIASGTLVSSLLKFGFGRPRPELVAHHVVYTSSFPSGHAMLSAVTFLTLGALLASAQASKRMKAYLLGLAVLLTLMVGASRVYLGVHWPTDVVAGWTAGAAWALLCWAVAAYLRRRGSVE
jgi:undecaprenyl-diphosphatase